jgi:nucleoside-diphosphate-sugar epimerase
MVARNMNMLITGANGNMGQKIARHMLAGTTTLKGEAAKWHVKLLDDYDGFCKGQMNDPTPSNKPCTGSVEYVQADMRAPGAWCSAFEDVDSVVHLHAWNPYPKASWEDARLSMDINNNAILAVQRGGVRRFIFASSNHVFGRY